MLVVMEARATEEQIRAVCERIAARGLEAHAVHGSLRTAVAITGTSGAIDIGSLESMPGVEECIAVSKPYKLSGRDAHPESTVIRITTPLGVVDVGGGSVGIIAGPCAI